MDDKSPNFTPFETLVVQRLNKIDKTLDLHNTEHADIQRNVNDIKINVVNVNNEVTNLKSKSSFWGCVGGIGSYLAYAILYGIFGGGGTGKH